MSTYFDNSGLNLKHKSEIVKGNLEIQFGAALPMTEVNFQKAVVDFNLEVYSNDQILRFTNDLKKGVTSSKLGQEDIEKAKKDLSKLIKMVVTDKNGDRRTVYVKRGEAKKTEGKKYESHTGEDEAAIKATIARQDALLKNPKSPASAKARAKTIISTEMAKLRKLGSSIAEDPRINRELKDAPSAKQQIEGNSMGKKITPADSKKIAVDWNKPDNGLSESIGKKEGGSHTESINKRLERKGVKLNKEEESDNVSEDLKESHIKALTRLGSGLERIGDTSNYRIQDTIAHQAKKAIYGRMQGSDQSVVMPKIKKILEHLRDNKVEDAKKLMAELKPKQRDGLRSAMNGFMQGDADFPANGKHVGNFRPKDRDLTANGREFRDQKYNPNTPKKEDKPMKSGPQVSKIQEADIKKLGAKLDKRVSRIK